MRWPWISRKEHEADLAIAYELAATARESIALAKLVQQENVEIREKLHLMTAKANRLAGMISGADRAFLDALGIKVE